jgi:hypothetical protein
MITPSIMPKAQKTATKHATSPRQPAPCPVVVPAHADIAARAYGIYLLGGRRQGFSERNWLRAEKELKNQSVKPLQSSPDTNVRPLASSEDLAGTGLRRN